MTEEKLANKILNARSKYEIFASRPMSIQRVSVVGNFCRDILGVSSLCIPLPDGKDSIWLEKSARLKYQKFIDELLIPSSFKKHLQDYKKFGRELILLGKKASKIKNDKQSLSNLYLAWIDKLSSFSIYFLSPFIIEDELYPRFITKVKDSSLISDISLPTTLFGYQKFQIELLGNEKVKDYDRLIEKYSWLSEYSLKESLLNKSDIKIKHQEIKKQKLESLILSYKVNLKKNRQKYQKAIKKLKGKERLMAEVIHHYVNIRTERIEIYQQALVGMRSFFHKFTELVKLDNDWFSYFDAINLTAQEVVYYLKEGSLPGRELMEKRRKREIIVFLPASSQGMHEQFIYKKSLVKNIIKDYSGPQDTSKLIKGVAVSGGIVRGKVRLVLNDKDFKNFRVGEILVSYYTAPAFMPIIKMAGAIITDEGGVTSHAAIVSRELKTPCIVGTKIATKILCDGDLVEVDANKGIVKIIKRAK